MLPVDSPPISEIPMAATALLGLQSPGIRCRGRSLAAGEIRGAPAFGRIFRDGTQDLMA